MTNENIAKAAGRDLSISTKCAIEISSFIRGKNLQRAKKMLEEVLKMKRAVPYTRFNKDRGHKAGKIAAGGYPINASKEILNLLKSVEANAQNKGLDTNSLFIKTIIANRASSPWHPGRHRRRKMKRTHVDIIVEEKVSKNKEIPKTKSAPKEGDVKK